MGTAKTAKPFAVWVNGKRYESAKDAAEAVSLLFGWRVRPAWVRDVVKNGSGTVTRGVTVSAAPPEESGSGKAAGKKPVKTPPPAPAAEPEAALPAPEGEPENAAPGKGVNYPLLRYPPGQSPLDRGLNRAER
ncbi:MAG: hypothetical protein LBQ88_11690 [Treponema sp.]|jgi:hypothetical protein|nr:hypothetical protein [Treponema sp.]